MTRVHISIARKKKQLIYSKRINKRGITTKTKRVKITKMKRGEINKK